MPSTSRTNEVAATPVGARTAPKKWEFVNVNKPKKIQDKDVISVVRAHAMRNVRRKQRLELTAQHQKKVKPVAPQAHHADFGPTAGHSIHMDPNDWFLGGEGDADWLMVLRGMLSKREFVNPGHLTSRNGDGNSAECDEPAQPTDYWQSYGEDEFRASERFMLATRRETPRSLVGDGVFDPFNAVPISDGTSYNSHVLNHCRCLLRNTFPFGQTRMKPSALALLIFSYIVVSVMALNCLPVDQRKGQNPLTQMWLPYALQDSTLFIATLTFAEVHLEILSGNYKSQRALLHKGDSIKAINARLGDREQALSNETIGAVAMLAAMEVCHKNRLLNYSKRFIIIFLLTKFFTRVS